MFGTRTLLATLVATSALVVVGGASGDSHGATVCAHGCAYTSIQAAIDAAAPGATVTVAPGRYAENLVVSKPLTLQGAGASTVLYPAVSGPRCSSGGGSLCPGGSNMILVQSSDVTIESVRLEGDNPTLTSGVVAGGADLDARNGIITDWRLRTPFHNVVVTDVRVADIYLRGIYAGDGGTFSFTNDRVDNVQADPASIAMFAFGEAGVMADNRVTNASDALSANWSRGTSFLGNDVSSSASGIHTDNNGGSGGVADTIRGNSVRDCTTDGYGVWVFAPYVSATVDDNRVSGCATALAAFGSGAAGATPSFTGNFAEGGDARTTDPNGTYGAYIATDLLGWGAADVNATLTGNTFGGFTTGLFVTQTRMFYGGTPAGQATVAAHGNVFEDNGTGAFGDVGTVVTADGNWWGCPDGPNGGGDCQTAGGTVQYTPWLTRRPDTGEH